jgi:dihydrofolate reductase
LKVSLIVAAGENNVIGQQGDLPWRLPEDLKRFRSLTTGHHILMGRRTWDSIGRPLPERTSLVLSRSKSLQLPGAHVLPSLHEALGAAAQAGESEAFVIGGASLFAEALPLADRIYLTRVHAAPEGDVFLPPIDTSLFREESAATHPIDGKHSFSFTFYVLSRMEAETVRESL